MKPARAGKLSSVETRAFAATGIRAIMRANRKKVDAAPRERRVNLKVSRKRDTVEQG